MKFLIWLSHISRVRCVGVVQSHMLRHVLHHSHCSKLVLCDGYLCHMMLVEIPSHHLQINIISLTKLLTLLILYANTDFIPLLFYQEVKFLIWLSHISRVRCVGVVQSHRLRHVLHHSHCSKLVLCDGYLCHMMLVEIPSHHLHHVSDLNSVVHSCQKNFRDCFSLLGLS